jgi:raffinose/stachyose/melibiose transport system substrate-binding protein
MAFSRTRTVRRGSIAAAAIAASALLALTGCAPGGTGPVATDVEVSTELTSDDVVLTIADETGFPLTDELAAEFTKQYPNVTFNVTRDTFANLTANAPKLLASDTPPDLIRLPTIGDTVKDGLIADLDPWFDAYGWDSWSQAQLAPLRVNEDNVRGSGSLYQLGLGYSITGIYMNKTHAATLGIDETPSTLAEFEEALAAAKAGGILPIMAGDKDGVVNFVVQAAMNQYADSKEMMDWILNVPGATYDTPGNVKGADLVRTWADAGYFPSDINAIDYASFVSRFQGGEGLFTFNGNWAAADTQAKMGDNVDFFLVPTAEEGGDHVAMGAANSVGDDRRGERPGGLHGQRDRRNLRGSHHPRVAASRDRSDHGPAVRHGSPGLLRTGARGLIMRDRNRTINPASDTPRAWRGKELTE